MGISDETSWFTIAGKRISPDTYACWSLAAGANPTLIAAQMGHANAQMVYTVYGAWMADNNQSQVDIESEAGGHCPKSAPKQVVKKFT